MRPSAWRPLPNHDVRNSKGTRILLRAITYLAPGIPLRFFELVAEYLARELGCETTLDSEVSSSGPMQGDHDPFAAEEADLGFLCSPSFLYLRSRPTPSVDLVPAGFVFSDERHGGAEAVYYSDVVVRADHAARCFDDLEGATWGYNDECSLSGYFATLQRLREIGCTGRYFRERVHTGSHAASIEAVLSGKIDAASIDSTALTLWRKDRPELAAKLREVASWGPFPVQPVVIRRGLSPELRERIAATLLALDCSRVTAAGLCEFGLERIVPIEENTYAEERRQLCALGEIKD